jgi:chorismate mutase
MNSITGFSAERLALYCLIEAASDSRNASGGVRMADQSNSNTSSGDQPGMENDQGMAQGNKPVAADDRSVRWSPEEWRAELLSLRQQIDRLDHGLVLMLANRFALTRRVGEIKARVGLDSFDPQREAEKIADIRELCGQHDVNPELVADILAQIMRETVRNHDKIRSNLQAKP